MKRKGLAYRIVDTYLNSVFSGICSPRRYLSYPSLSSWKVFERKQFPLALPNEKSVIREHPYYPPTNPPVDLVSQTHSYSFVSQNPSRGPIVQSKKARRRSHSTIFHLLRALKGATHVNMADNVLLKESHIAVVAAQSV